MPMPPNCSNALHFERFGCLEPHLSVSTLTLFLSSTLAFWHTLHLRRRFWWGQISRPPHWTQLDLRWLCSQNNKWLAWASLVGTCSRGTQARLEILLPSLFSQAAWPILGTNTCAFFVFGCRQNQLLLKIYSHCEHFTFTLCSEVKTSGKLLTCGGGTKLSWTPEYFVALRSFGAFSKVSAPVSDLVSSSNFWSLRHWPVAKVDKWVGKSSLSKICTRYSKAGASASCVLASAKSKWAKQDISSFLTLDCKFSLQPFPSLLGLAASLLTAVAKTGARSHPAHLRTIRQMASPSGDSSWIKASSCLSTCAIISDLSSASALRNLPMLRWNLTDRTGSVAFESLFAVNVGTSSGAGCWRSTASLVPASSKEKDTFCPSCKTNGADKNRTSEDTPKVFWYCSWPPPW